jgi:hypothetical protein
VHADVLNNIVRNNPVAGIAIQYDSSARVGWSGPPNARVSAPNTIENNGGAGLQITRGSSAQIFTNVIEGNGRDAIRVMRNSGVDMGTDVNACWG